MTYNSIKSVQVKFIIREVKFDSIEKDIEINMKYIESGRYQVYNYNSEETEQGDCKLESSLGYSANIRLKRPEKIMKGLLCLAISLVSFIFFSNDTMSCTYILVKRHFEHTLHFLHPIFS